MGLGILGRGVGDAEFLVKAGADLIVTDLKRAKDLSVSLRRLRKYRNIKFVLGQHRLQDFNHRDFIIRGANIPIDSPFIAFARKHKVPTYMSTALFAKLSGAKIIGITGTRGKSTTTQLIYHLMKEAGIKVFLGGNVVGISTLALLSRVKSGDWVVLELDSWQLQGFGELKLSPSIAVFTNFFPDHLNYYHGDLRRYFRDKSNIYRFQKKNEVVFVGREVASKVKSHGRKMIVAPLAKNWEISLPGKHNRANAALAVAVAKEIGLKIDFIRQALVTFPGLVGRLELIRRWRGIRFYNDTTSTTPEALSVALEALSPVNTKKIILIMGGADKNLDLKQSLSKVSKFCKTVILLPGTGTDKLPVSFKSSCHLVKNMNMAIKIAAQSAQTGDIVLLSPGLASFGLFKNEFDRGEKFNFFVKRLK